MSDGGVADRGGNGASGEVVDLARALRAELQAISEGELRRQARLVAFDHQMAQMEASIRGEVERLRTTGSVVELLADLLRRSLEEVQSDHKLDPIREQLAHIREDVSQLPPPDDQRVLAAVSALTDRLEGLERSVADLQDQDALTPITTALDQLHVRVAAISTRDLRPIHDQLEAVRQAVEALPVHDDSALRAEVAAVQAGVADLPRPDIDGVLARIAELRAEISAQPVVDLAPLQDRLADIQRDLRDLPQPDDTAVQSSIAAVAGRLTDLQETVGALPAAEALREVAQDIARLGLQVSALPVHDDAQLREEVRRLAAELDGLRTTVADRFDALPGADAVVAAVAPLVASLRDELDPLPVVNLVEQAANNLSQRVAAVSAATDSIIERVEVLPDYSTQLEALVRSGEAHEGGLSRLGELVAALPDQTQPVQTLSAGMEELLGAVTTLQTMIEASSSAHSDAADAQGLALARVVAAADGFASAVGTLRTAMGTAATAASDQTIAAVDERMDGRLRSMETRLSSTVAASLDQLDPQPLRDQVRGLEDILRSGEADRASLRDGVDALRRELARLAPTDVAPLAARLDSLAELIAAIPSTDVSSLAANLAHLNAAITSQSRVRAAEATDLEALGASVGETTTKLFVELERQSDQVEAIAIALRALPSADETRAIVDQRLGQGLEAMQSHLAAMAERVDRTAAASEKAAQVALHLLQATTRDESAGSTAKKAGGAKKVAGKKAAAKKTPGKKAAPAPTTEDATTPPAED